MKYVALVAMGALILLFNALQLILFPPKPVWGTIANDFVSPSFWLIQVVMLLGGAFGGVSYELLLRGGAIELPHRVKRNALGRTYTHAPAETLIALGTLGRGLVGAAAAVCVLMVNTPSSSHAAIALSVTAGAAAPALIRLLRKQVVQAADVLGLLRRNDQRRAAAAALADARPGPRPAPAAQAA